MTAVIALDSSVALPLLIQSHRAHAEVFDWMANRKLALCGHALAETYSVLTRLPGDLRVASVDAPLILRRSFAPPLVLGSEVAASVADIFGKFGIAGGAVYDGLVALAAAEHHAVLATRDARAEATYAAVGIETVVVG